MGLRHEVACALALASGCYEPSFGRCDVRCVDGDECPSGLVCSARFCVEPGTSGSDCRGGGSDGGLPGGDRPDVSNMVLFVGGPFQMGCDLGESDCQADEQPLHEVTLSAFEIDPTEVTQTAYLECVEAGACQIPEDAPERDGPEWDPDAMPDHPVFHVTWYMADEYCTFAGKRLPTEAEWERAARGPGDTRRRYPWGDDAPSCLLANRNGCGNGGSPLPVASLPLGQTPEGVHDMAGNVFEWVADWYDETYYENSASVDPTGPATPGVDNLKANRGFGFATDSEFLRASNRNAQPIDSDPFTFGIRCARSVE